MEQMKSPRALVLDLDGTLIPSGRVDIDAHTMGLVRELSGRMVVAIASGRCKDSVTEFARAMSLTAPQISENGARLFSPADGTDLYASEMPLEVSRALLADPAIKGAQPFVCGADGLSVGPDGDRPITMVTSPIGSLKEGVKLGRRLERDYGITADVSSGTEGQIYVVLVAQRRTKGYGVTRLAVHTGVELDDVMAIGDGLNDLSMFKIAGTAVAIGGKLPEVVAGADLVAQGVDEVLERVLRASA